MKNTDQSTIWANAAEQRKSGTYLERNNVNSLAKRVEEEVLKQLYADAEKLAIIQNEKANLRANAAEQRRKRARIQKVAAGLAKKTVKAGVKQFVKEKTPVIGISSPIQNEKANLRTVTEAKTKEETTLLNGAHT